MSEGFIKAFLESKNGWIAIIIFILYIAYKLIDRWLINKKETSKQEKLEGFFSEIRNKFIQIADVIDQSRLKNRIIDSIDYKLKVIHSQYGGELNKEMATVIIRNIYLNFSNQVADEIYEIKKLDKSANETEQMIRNKIDILNDDKMHELDLFMYHKKILITFTNGKIINPDIIINCVKNYSSRNGLLREQIQNLLLIEANKIIKSF